MKVRNTLCLGLVASALGACATPQNPSAPLADARRGAVRGIYVEVAPDIYLERALVGDAPGTAWAQVALAEQPATTVRARIAPGQLLAVGDTVRLQLAGPHTYEAELLPEISRVVAVMPRATGPTMSTMVTPVDRIFLGTLARE